MFHSLWLLRRKIQEVGFRPALGHATKMMYRKLFSRGDIIFTLCLSDWNITPPEWLPSFSACPLYSLEHLSETDQETLREYGGDRMAVENFATQFAQGATPWVGRIEGQLVGVCWVFPASTSLDYFFPLLEGDAVISNCFTIPRYRRKGIFSGILYHIVKTGSKEGLRHVFINCKIWNTASMRGILKVGFKEIAVANSVRIARQKITIWHRPDIKQKPNM